MDVSNGFSDPDKAFTLSWANSMGTFTTSFSRSISPLGGFGGPERTESFGVGCWLYCVVSAEVPGSSSGTFWFSQVLGVLISNNRFRSLWFAHRRPGVPVLFPFSTFRDGTSIVAENFLQPGIRSDIVLLAFLHEDLPFLQPASANC